jgi:hypothetical protein
LKTDYVAIAWRRGEGRGNWLMSKTGYVEIASRLVMVVRSCFSVTIAQDTEKIRIQSGPWRVFLIL